MEVSRGMISVTIICFLHEVGGRIIFPDEGSGSSLWVRSLLQLCLAASIGQSARLEVFSLVGLMTGRGIRRLKVLTMEEEFPWDED